MIPDVDHQETTSPKQPTLDLGNGHMDGVLQHSLSFVFDPVLDFSERALTFLDSFLHRIGATHFDSQEGIGRLALRQDHTRKEREQSGPHGSGGSLRHAFCVSRILPFACRLRRTSGMLRPYTPTKPEDPDPRARIRLEARLVAKAELGEEDSQVPYTPVSLRLSQATDSGYVRLVLLPCFLSSLPTLR